MISFKLSELAVFGNYLLKGNDLEISSVSTDSRACRDALFVALIGERFDAHDFIEKAIENGAVAVLASRKLPEQIENRVAVGRHKAGLIERIWMDCCFHYHH